jgi:hypothetical protein
MVWMGQSVNFNDDQYKYIENIAFQEHIYRTVKSVSVNYIVCMGGDNGS